MKKNYTVKILLIFLMASALSACSESNMKKKAVHENHQAREYTCSMHPQVVQDKPGTCPICGMELVPRHTPGTETMIDSGLAHLLKPVNEQVVSSISTVRPESGSKIITSKVQGRITYDARSQSSVSSRVSGRIERLLIKYNYQPVKKGQLIMEIYSPDLAAAQRELLMIAETDKTGDLLNKAKERLRLLGMQNGQISTVLKSGKILYRVPVYSNVNGYILQNTVAKNQTNANGFSLPASADAMGGQNVPSATGSADANAAILIREGQYVQAGQSLFTIYRDDRLLAEFALKPALASQIKNGQKLIFYRNSEPDLIYTGAIGLISPALDAGSNFTRARVYLKNNDLEIGQLVTGEIPVMSSGWWLPQKSVLSLGDKHLVFKKEEKGIFVPVEIETRMSVNGHVLVAGDVENWEVAENAAFLVDSENFIKGLSVNQVNNKQ